ncbi:MAG TPA: glycoside hydrolase family 99-like domain-containing protein, partial [bacterium]|nr:glycoside hydrolase family 99-like domain-containing protein [bacterium]
VCYAPLLAGMLQGDFSYRPWGLLDQTHLRFFGLRNMQRLFEEAGYKIVQAELVRARPEHSEFAAAWGSLSAEQREMLSALPGWDTYQVVLRAVPAARWPGPSLALEALATPALSVAPAGPAALAGRPRLVAFHLPQFHPFDENDQWWGRGFTEWTNVTKALPLFPGHDQPQLPTELGFYDLRLRGSMRAQAKLAEEHGIGAFCYHYYWFDGRRLMAEPLKNLLADAAQRLPFCLCWANESWSRRWDGSEDELLIAQSYGQGWEDRFFDDLLPYLRDARYLRQDGLPLLVVYRPTQIPDAAAVFQGWRRRAEEAGLGGLHVCAALTHGNGDYRPFGADSGVEFPPHNSDLPILRPAGLAAGFRGRVHEHADLAEQCLQRRYPDQLVFRTVVPAWDNSPRTGMRGFVLVNGGPHNYEQWLDRALELGAAEQPGRDKLVFINGWNEWAEGCHLEPDRTHGRGYLEATLRALRGATQRQGFKRGMSPAWVRVAERLWRSAAGLPRLKAWMLGHPRLLGRLQRLRGAWR